MMRLGIGSVLVVLLCGSGMLHAAATTQPGDDAGAGAGAQVADARQGVLDYIAAIKANDVEAAKGAIVYAGVDKWGFVDLVTQLAIEPRRVMAAVRDRFGAQATEQASRVLRDSTLDELAQVYRAGTLQTQGDEATLTVKALPKALQGEGPNITLFAKQYHLKRVGGTWKIDLDQTMHLPPGRLQTDMFGKGQVEFFWWGVRAMRQIEAEVRSGKLATLAAVQEAMEQRPKVLSKQGAPATRPHEK